MLKEADFQERLQKFLPGKGAHISDEEKVALAGEIKTLLKEKNAVIVAHYYTDPEIQRLAEDTGGFVGDSLEMARFGSQNPATTLVVAGVRFMGESAKILSPEKTVLMPDLGAECSLDIGCEAAEFKAFCDEHPDRTVVVYANTSASVKAVADWVVTSSIAVDVVKHLTERGAKILWGPDRYLGDYIKLHTNADMLLWNAYCVVHAEFDAGKIIEMKKLHPDADILVHPESQAQVIALADVVGSTSHLLRACQARPARKFIVATESGILYKMQKAAPDKEFLFAPTSPLSSSINCEANCPWMKMNNLQNLRDVLKTSANAIEISSEIISLALVPLERMVNFRK